MHGRGNDAGKLRGSQIVESTLFSKKSYNFHPRFQLPNLRRCSFRKLR